MTLIDILKLIAVSAALAGAVWLIRNLSRPPASQAFPQSSQPLSSLLITPLAFAALAIMVAAGQPSLISGDEYCRADYALQWSAAPYFAPADHIWLPGQFYVLGGIHRITSHMPGVVAATSIIGTTTLVLAVAWLAALAWPTLPSASWIAGLLISANVVLFWASFNAVAEVFSLPIITIAMALLLRAETLPTHNNEAPTHPLAPDAWRLAAAAVLAIGTMFRFEPWFAGIALGMWLCWLALRAFILGNFSALGMRLLAASLLAIYPILWLGSSWRNLGSPLAFARDASTMNTQTNLMYDFSSPLAKLLVYPTSIWADHRWLVVLGLIGCGVAIIITLHTARQRWLARPFGQPQPPAAPPASHHAIAMVAITLGLWAISMLVSMKTGIGSNHRPRYTIFLLVPLVALAAGPLAAMVDGWRRSLLPAARFAVASLLAAIMLLVAVEARTSYPNAWSIHPGTSALCQYLSLEQAEHRFGHERLWPWHTPLILSHGGYWDDFWMISYHTGRRAEIAPLGAHEQVVEFAATMPARTRLLMREGALPAHLPPNARLLTTLPPYTLYVLE